MWGIIYITCGAIAVATWMYAQIIAETDRERKAFYLVGGGFIVSLISLSALTCP